MPCGTPETTSIRLDCLSSTTTRCFLFFCDNYKSIDNFSIYAVVLECTKESVSKAFEKSKTAMSI